MEILMTVSRIASICTMNDCFRKLICQATRNKMNFLSRYFGFLWAQTMTKTTLPQVRTISFARGASMTIHKRAFSSSGDTEEEEEEMLQKKKKKDHKNTRITFGSIGRKIPHRLIHVINENGEDLGTMHRANVIRIMDERGLKLVPVRENDDPPVFQLLTGKQIHEEQLKRREMQKDKPKTGITQIKELTFSATIAKHDLETKTKQIQLWLEKMHHVRIIVQKGSANDGTDKLVRKSIMKSQGALAKEMEVAIAQFHRLTAQFRAQILDQIVDSMPKAATFVSKPKLIKEGKSAICVIRHTSEKELRDYKKKQKEILKDVCPSDKEGGIAETSSSMVLSKGEEIN